MFVCVHSSVKETYILVKQTYILVKRDLYHDNVRMRTLVKHVCIRVVRQVSRWVCMFVRVCGVRERAHVCARVCVCCECMYVIVRVCVCVCT